MKIKAKEKGQCDPLLKDETDEMIHKKLVVKGRKFTKQAASVIQVKKRLFIYIYIYIFKSFLYDKLKLFLLSLIRIINNEYF